jgi:hypothetical protein
MTTRRELTAAIRRHMRLVTTMVTVAGCRRGRAIGRSRWTNLALISRSSKRRGGQLNRGPTGF